MARCGESCFSRCVVRLTEDRPSLFGRLVGILVYALFLGLVTMAHKGFLLYHYYTFLEKYDVDPIPQAFLDGIPSYVTPAYVILLLVVLPFILCACCGLGCKVKNLVHWLLALVIGAAISSLLSYTAQIILYIIRLVFMFLERKAFLIAMCYCTSRGGLQNFTTSTDLTPTQEMMTSTQWTAQTHDVTNDVTTSSVTFDASSNGVPFVNFDEIKIFDDDVRTTLTGFWCQCDVPFEPYPVGVTADSPDQIDDLYLRNFGVEDYSGEVNVSLVGSTQQVKDMVDVELVDFKMFLSLLQGVAVVIVLRFPLWLVINNLWSHVLLLEFKVKWGIERLRRSRMSRQPSGSGGCSRIAEFVGRSRKHIKSKRPTSRESTASYDISLGPDDSDRTDYQVYSAGVQQGIRKGQNLPKPPKTLVPVMETLFFCLLETLDAFSLLDEIFYRRHFFKDNMAFTTAILALVGVNLCATMIINVMTTVPVTERGKGFHVIRFLLVFLTNVGFLIVRIWLFILYGAFKNSQVSSVYLLFIIKETLMFIYEIVQFGLEMSVLRIKDSKRHTAEVLGRWRNYTEGIQSDKIDTVWIRMNGRSHGAPTDTTGTNTEDGESVRTEDDESNELPVYSARNTNYGNSAEGGSTPFERDYRYFQNDKPVYGKSYGVSSPDVIDLSHIREQDGGFVGPELMGGVATFTRRSSRKQQRQHPPTSPKKPKYTEEELQDMVFYI